MSELDAIGSDQAPVANESAFILGHREIHDDVVSLARLHAWNGDAVGWPSEQVATHRHETASSWPRSIATVLHTPDLLGSETRFDNRSVGNGDVCHKLGLWANRGARSDAADAFDGLLDPLRRLLQVALELRNLLQLGLDRRVSCLG